MIIAVLAVLWMTAPAQTWMTNSTSWVNSSSGGSNPSNTVDNDTLTLWQSPSAPAWIVYQFPTPVSISDFKIKLGTPLSSYVKFEYHNGTGFVTLATLTPVVGGGWVQSSTFNLTTATTWRVLLQNATKVYEVNFGLSCAPSYSTQSITECVSWTSPTGVVHTQSGTYADTLQNSCGMDSVITTNLTINTVDVSVTQNGATLTANATYASVGWVSCPSMTFIQPGQSFTATQNGSYACIVYQNACWDTSDCYDIVITEVQQAKPKPATVTLYPNPTTGHINIAGAGDEPTVTAYDMTGRMVLRARSNSIDIELPGTYVVDVNGARYKVLVIE